MNLYPNMVRSTMSLEEEQALRRLNAELVEACEALLIVHERGECEAMHPDLAANMARAAIAKAKGEA